MEALHRHYNGWFWMTHGDWNDDEFDDSDFSLSLLIERQRMWKCARVALCELQWVQSSVKKIQSKSFVGSVQWQLGRRKNSLSLILITVVLKKIRNKVVIQKRWKLFPNWMRVIWRVKVRYIKEIMLSFGTPYIWWLSLWHWGWTCFMYDQPL